VPSCLGERLYRDIRVDHIWEGASEIQCAIIGGQIKKRGMADYVDWVKKVAVLCHEAGS
jgi:hypothetical protein